MKYSTKSCIVNSVIYGIILNLVLPIILIPFATNEEIMAPNGANALSFKGQFMHMMIHHNQVPFMSSVIVAIIVGLSVFLGYAFKLYPFKFGGLRTKDL